MSKSVRVFSPLFPLLYYPVAPRTTATSNMNVHPKGKELAVLFFPSLKRKGDRWVCEECDTSVLQIMSGYTYLCHHITNKNSDGTSERQNSSHKLKREPFHVIAYPAWTVPANGWSKCVIHCLTLSKLSKITSSSANTAKNSSSWTLWPHIYTSSRRRRRIKL